jgi:hypothetical protein
MDSKKLFDAAVAELAEHVGPMAALIVEDVFTKTRMPLNGVLDKQQSFILLTMRRAELPKQVDTYSAIKRIEAKART